MTAWCTSDRCKHTRHPELAPPERIDLTAAHARYLINALDVKITRTPDHAAAKPDLIDLRERLAALAQQSWALSITPAPEISRIREYTALRYRCDEHGQPDLAEPCALPHPDNGEEATA